MDCKKAEKFLVEYFYRELSPKRTVEMEHHLQNCDKCAQTLESWGAIHRAFHRTAEEPQASGVIKQKLMAAAREELGRKASFSDKMAAFLRPAMVLPVLLLTVVAIYFVSEQRSTRFAKVAPMSSPQRRLEKSEPEYREKVSN